MIVMPSAAAPSHIHRQVIDRPARLTVGGTWAPGDALPCEDRLACQLVVSRSVLREAMPVRGARGLIESRQKTGARVRERRFWQQIDADVPGWRFAAIPAEALVAERVEMRDIIAAAPKPDHAQLVAIAVTYEAMDRDAWACADAQFHGAVLNAANNKLMSSLFNVVEIALRRFFLLSARASDDFRYSLPRHVDGHDAIRKRSGSRACAVMQRVLDDSRVHLYPRGAAA